MLSEAVGELGTRMTQNLTRNSKAKQDQAESSCCQYWIHIFFYLVITLLFISVPSLASSSRSSLAKLYTVNSPNGSFRSSYRFFSFLGTTFIRQWEPPPTYDEELKHINPNLARPYSGFSEHRGSNADSYGIIETPPPEYHSHDGLNCVLSFEAEDAAPWPCHCRRDILFHVSWAFHVQIDKHLLLTFDNHQYCQDNLMLPVFLVIQMIFTNVNLGHLVKESESTQGWRVQPLQEREPLHRIIQACWQGHLQESSWHERM